MRLIATGRKLSTKTSLLPMGQLRTGTTIGWYYHWLGFGKRDACCYVFVGRDVILNG